MEKTLVIFSGWGSNNRFYRGVRQTAPEDWKVVIVHYDNFINKDASLDKFNEKLINYLDKLGVKRFNLLGHSLGGALAIIFSYLHPELVENLYLVCSEGIADNQSVARVIANTIKANRVYAKKRPQDVLHLAAALAKRPIWHTRLAKFAHKANLQEEARSIKVPTVIMWGEKDNLTPLWQGEELHKLISNSRLVVFPGLNHDFIWHSPHLFWQNI